MWLLTHSSSPPLGRTGKQKVKVVAGWDWNILTEQQRKRETTTIITIKWVHTMKLLTNLENWCPASSQAVCHKHLSHTADPRRTETQSAVCAWTWSCWTACPGKMETRQQWLPRQWVPPPDSSPSFILSIRIGLSWCFALKETHIIFHSISFVGLQCFRLLWKTTSVYTLHVQGKMDK